MSASRTTPRRVLAAVAGVLLWTSTESSAETVAYEGAVVHTVAGPVIEDASVVVTDGLIVAVGADVDVPGTARRVDLRGFELYPGLINMGTLLGLYEIGAVAATRDERELGEINPNIRAEVALNPSSEQLPVARADGILAFLTFPTSGVVAGTAALAYTYGWTVEDLAARRGVALVVNWPRMALDWQAKKGLDDQREARDRRVRQLDDAFADAEAYADARERSATPPDRDVKWDAMRPVVRGEMPLLVRTSDATEIRGALDWAERHSIRIILEAARDAGAFAAELAEREIPVILVAAHMRRPRDGEPYDALYAEPAALHAAGVKVAFGTGPTPYGTYNARQLPDLAGIAVGFGLPRDGALRALTLSAAEIAGAGDRLGSIEVGKEATFIVTDGDVLEIRTHVVRAVVRGVEVSLDNKQRRLYETYDARPVAP